MGRKKYTRNRINTAIGTAAILNSSIGKKFAPNPSTPSSDA